MPDITDMAVDVGLSKEEASALIQPGDMVLLPGEPRRLLGSRVTGAALDDRAGCAALIRCAQLLQGEELSCRVTILLSTREEVGSQGAETGSFPRRARYGHCSRCKLCRAARRACPQVRQAVRGSHDWDFSDS